MGSCVGFGNRETNPCGYLSDLDGWAVPDAHQGHHAASSDHGPKFVASCPGSSWDCVGPRRSNEPRSRGETLDDWPWWLVGMRWLLTLAMQVGQQPAQCCMARQFALRPRLPYFVPSEDTLLGPVCRAWVRGSQGGIMRGMVWASGMQAHIRDPCRGGAEGDGGGPGDVTGLLAK